MASSVFTVAEALAEAAIIQRYFGTRAASTASAAFKTEASVPLVPSPSRAAPTTTIEATRTMHTARTVTPALTQPEHVRFLSMFGHKTCSKRAMDPIIVAAFSSTGGAP